MTIPPKYEDVVAKLDAALGREAALREELESIKASVDGYDSPEHAAQVADDMGHQCDALQQRLTVADQRVDDLEGLLRDADSAHGNMLMSDPPQEAWKYHRISERIAAALKPAADAKSSPPCPNCKVCMGSPDFPENCLINGVKP